MRRWLIFVVLLAAAIRPVAAQDNGEDFGMTGVMISGQENFRAVSSVLPHSPADDAGVKAGDRVLAIDFAGTADLNMQEFVNKMRGKPDSEVVLTILSKENGVVLNLTMKRVSVRAYHATNP